MYLDNNPEKCWVLDIESDGLDPTVIWCCVVRNLQTEEELVFTEKDSFNEWYASSDKTIIGHNAISFDANVINKLWETGIDLDTVIDTLVLSYLYDPSLEGGHSLEAWGTRMKFPKQDFSDWSAYTPLMLEYCKNDVALTAKVYRALVKRMKALGYSEKSCEIEHRIRVVIDEQQRTGFWFDKVRAGNFLGELRKLQSDLSEEIQKLFPPKRTLVKEGTIRRTKKGRLHAQLGKDVERYAEVVINEENDTYECYDFIPFNLGSPVQRVDRLLSLGWKPEKFTPNGFPKVDEDALLAFSKECNRSEVAALADWLVLQGRASMLDTWFNNLGDDSRIHGRILTCGATTRRMIHSSPNTANIPKAHKDVKYGHECRSFWSVEPGHDLVLVGYDASGLETAGLCHYLNNPTATDILLRPKPDDIHTANARRLTTVLGRNIDREVAKTAWYAWLYGAGLAKLGTIVKGGVKDGQAIVDAFFSNVPGLKQLIDGIQYEFQTNRGGLQTIDGGFVLCTSKSAALNYKIQSAGAIVMKETSILLREEIMKRGLRAKRVGDIHDEGQLECHEEDAERVGQLAVQCITDAGLALGFRVHLTGDYKIGSSWAVTH